MQLVFFIAHLDDARAVTSSHALPGDPAADPIAAHGPAALHGLGAALAPHTSAAFLPLRDQTCRSYPAWILSPDLHARLESLEPGDIDVVADSWLPHEETDAYERACCLTALRDALRSCEPGETLFALLEERAL
jgi:hypothetical protein